MIKPGHSSVILMLAILLSVNVYANKSDIEIIAPDTAVKGSVITIRINVTHNANNIFHHTKWAYIKVNGNQVGIWGYPFNSKNFSKEVQVNVTGQLEIEAMSYCNIHGSTGARTKTVSIK